MRLCRIPRMPVLPCRRCARVLHRVRPTPASHATPRPHRGGIGLGGAFKNHASVRPRVGVDPHMDQAFATPEVLIDPLAQRVVERPLVAVGELLSRGLGQFPRESAPTIVAFLREIDEQARNVAVDDRCPEHHAQELREVQRTRLPSLGRVECLLVAAKQLPIGLGHGAGGMFASKEEGGHGRGDARSCAARGRMAIPRTADLSARLNKPTWFSSDPS